MTTFRRKWSQVVQNRQTQLCVGLDPAEVGQKAKQTLPVGIEKKEWCRHFIDSVAPFAAAIKINRNFIKDLSRSETQGLVQQIHDWGMLAIDDSKLCDVGSSNYAGLYHATVEGFDGVTFSPFPGNIHDTATQAKELNIGVIGIVLMSNPEYERMKNLKAGAIPYYQQVCQEMCEADMDGLVIGAISPQNHLSKEEIKSLKPFIKDQVILVPGMGEQGGDIGCHMELFGDQVMVNVGRAIMYAPDFAHSAAQYRDEIAVKNSVSKAS